MNRIMLVCLLVLSSVVQAETVAITGATVHTVGPRGTIDNGTIIITDGRIAEVGIALPAPAGATVIDASGKIITPGLFSPSGYLGLVEVGLSAGPLDAVQRGDQFAASFDIADAFNPRSTLIAINRIEGVTRAAITPRPAALDAEGYRSHVFSGLAATVNLAGDAGSVDKRAAALVVTLGESGSALAGESRVAPLLVLKSALDEAIDYRDNRVAVQQGLRREYVTSMNDLEALQLVLSGTTPLLANVDRASDIEALIRLVNEFGLRAIVQGGVEAWTLADELAAANIAVIVAPEANLPSNFDKLNARSGAATILADAGVTISFTETRSEPHNARNITQQAGNAVVDGLSWNAALRAITLAPAQMFGVADRLGSIEAGKEADIVIWPDDPLELTSFPETVIIRGQQVPMQSRQTLLRDRYLEQSESPPAFRR